MPAPDGSVQIIRGPRPPTEGWPKVTRSVCRSTEFISVSSWTGTCRRLASDGEDVAMEAAKRLGQPLQLWVQLKALKFNSSKSAFRRPFVLITVLSSQTKAFVERTQKRLKAHDAARQQRVLEFKRAKVAIAGSCPDAGSRKSTAARGAARHGPRKFDICNRY